MKTASENAMQYPPSFCLGSFQSVGDWMLPAHALKSILEPPPPRHSTPLVWEAVFISSHLERAVTKARLSGSLFFVCFDYVFSIQSKGHPWLNFLFPVPTEHLLSSKEYCVDPKPKQSERKIHIKEKNLELSFAMSFPPLLIPKISCSLRAYTDVFHFGITFTKEFVISKFALVVYLKPI